MEWTNNWKTIWIAHAIKEIEPLINCPEKKALGQDGFSGKVYQIFQEEGTPILPNLFRKTETEEARPNSLCELNVTVMPTTNEDSRERKLCESTYSISW